MPGVRRSGARAGGQRCCGRRDRSLPTDGDVPTSRRQNVALGRAGVVTWYLSSWLGLPNYACLSGGVHVGHLPRTPGRAVQAGGRPRARAGTACRRGPPTPSIRDLLAAVRRRPAVSTPPARPRRGRRGHPAPPPTRRGLTPGRRSADRTRPTGDLTRRPDGAPPRPLRRPRRYRTTTTLPPIVANSHIASAVRPRHPDAAGPLRRVGRSAASRPAPR